MISLESPLRVDGNGVLCDIIVHIFGQVWAFQKHCIKALLLVDGVGHIGAK